MNTFDDLTDAHLLRADEDYRFSLRLLELEEPAPRWAVAAAFYASIHYLSAWFWNEHQIVVNNHRHRGRMLRSGDFDALSPIVESYEYLYRKSLESRYQPAFSISSSEVDDLLRTDLESIRNLINRELQR